MTDSLGELIFMSLARRGEWAVILKLYTVRCTYEIFSIQWKREQMIQISID